jgi:SAM-dependent methyltransferase
LDVGCGEGVFLQYGGAITFGIDRNAHSVRMCVARGLCAACADALHLPFRDGHFDGVHCAHVIEHLPPGSALQLLIELARVLQSGGLLVIQAPLLGPAFYNDFSHVRPYTPMAILRYLGCDRRQQTLDDAAPMFKFIALRWRYAPLLPALVPPMHMGRLELAVYSMSLMLYYIGIHGPTRDGYMLVLQKEG